MPRRIEVELTSNRDDGTWTWRAAGAREPKGTLDGSLLFEGAKVGDVVRADADFDVDGITVTAVQPPKGSRREPERLEIVGQPPRDDQLVTSTLAPKRRGGKGERGRRGADERGDRRGGERRDGARGRPRSERPEGDARRGRPRGERPRQERPAPEPKPKPKRLRPARAHRSAVLESLPEEERPIAEQVLRGGIPAVRQAIDKQNEQASADGRPEVKADPLVAMAERLLPSLRSAEWRDRADAAMANLDELDLRDLRSVVVAADTAARDDETRELASQLREGLSRRVEAEHAAWLDELSETLRSGRVVRALRLSSRPPKAGAPLPAELGASLAAAAGEAMGPEVTQERWATVLDAVAYSPVRQHVTPAAVPDEPNEALLTAVRKLAGRVPEIAARFGIDPATAPKRAPRKAKRSPGRTPPPPPATATEPTPSGTPAEPTPSEPPAEPSPSETATPASPSSAEAPTEPAATPSGPAPDDAPVEASAEASDVAHAIERSVDEASTTAGTDADTEAPEPPEDQAST